MTATATQPASARPSAAAEFASAVGTIMVKELRSRMRGRRAFVVLTAYLGLLAFVAYGVYLVVAPVARQGLGAGAGLDGFALADMSALIGRSIFSVLSVLQLVLVAVIAPAFTAGQISLEREKQTLDLLVTTPLRPGAIVIGKLATALAFVVLMIVAAIPIGAIVLMYGGAEPIDLVRQQLVLLAVAIGFGAVGIFASALTRRTQTATVVTYLAVIGAIIGSAMLYGFWQVLGSRDDPLGLRPGQTAPEVIRYVNPMVAMLDVTAYVDEGGNFATRPLYELFGQDIAFGVVVDVPIRAGDPDAGDLIGDVAVRQPGHWWPRVSLTLLGVAAVLTVASMRLVVPGSMRSVWRSRRPAATAAVPMDGDDPDARA